MTADSSGGQNAICVSGILVRPDLFIAERLVAGKDLRALNPFAWVGDKARPISIPRHARPAPDEDLIKGDRFDQSRFQTPGGGCEAPASRHLCR